MLKLAILLLCVWLLCSASKCNVGSYSAVDPERPDVVIAANFTIQELNKNSTSPYLLKIALVQSAKRQVVNGDNYKLTIIVGFTCCKKNETSEEDVSDCKFQLGKHMFFSCRVTAYQSLDMHLFLRKSYCFPPLNRTMNAVTAERNVTCVNEANCSL